MTVTHGTLLGGRIRYAQPTEGYRTGIEPVLLAASIPARPGERVLEAGTGAGAALLCLAARVPGVIGVGLECDRNQAALAAVNFAANGFSGMVARHADVLAWQTDAPFDHAFANPPWHDAGGTPSANPDRCAAKTANAGLLEKWTKAMAAALRPRATLSLIVPASHLAQAIAALNAAHCREITLFPLWPKLFAPAKIIILRGVHQGGGSCRVAHGLLLHEADGRYTAEAENILRHGAALAGAL